MQPLALVSTALIAADAPEVALNLPPSKDNPRNSEGDFVTLKDGRILFIYTHFTGGGRDDSSAYLASRVSKDGGKTWSKILYVDEHTGCSDFDMDPENPEILSNLARARAARAAEILANNAKGTRNRHIS